MNMKEFKERLFAAGGAAGLEEMEIFVSRTSTFSTRVFQQEVDDYKVSVEQGVGFRARYFGKVGYAYSELLDHDSVELLINEVKANAQLIESSDDIEFFEGSAEYPEVTAFNPLLQAVSAEEKIEFTKSLESQAFATDERVSMVNYAVTRYSESEVYIANTKGLEQSFARNGAVSLVSAVVKDGEQTKTGVRILFGNDWEAFDAARLAQEAVREATSLLGAKSVPSGDYPVLLRHDVARDLLATFASVFSAEDVQKGLSLLSGKVGQQIASPRVTLVDDPLLKNGGASAPFDGEGVATRATKVIDSGKLTTFLHNLKTAKKEGVESTGNASRPSFKSSVGISPTNFFIAPGTATYEELITKMGNGIIIIDVQGLHSGANPVSGDFSLGAYGYLVENGQIVGAVEQITVAGNFFEVLQKVTEVGSDLEFGSPGLGGHVGSPTLLIDCLSIAGT